MGLLTVLRKTKQKEKEMRLLMLGLDNAGKTTILKRINGENIDEISPTLGFNIKTLEYNNYKLNIWDVGGQKSLRSYWRNYFEENDGIVWVVDSADIRRLLNCKEELQLLLKEEKLAGASLLIFANKQDVPGAHSLEQIIEVLGLKGGAAEEEDDGTTIIHNIGAHRHWNIMACSAVTGKGLLEGINWMVDDIASRIYLLD
ncbi:ADP-ribosylation factor-like protein 2-like isoform 1 [Planoprotostelium fungivorum]|uniref:ADP-ribosylation factor-like protein 2 n=1 Tax=Planoprotostelium fungivorum TaxID=1890364 RepID=A0A2P6N3L1_9EUKA|nr:ADP-ribosylation factor-like protein 2-like isoform 1 [Planoprotostelium fungivorum]